MGNTAIPQVKVLWTSLPESSATWEDYYVLNQRFPGLRLGDKLHLRWGEVSWVTPTSEAGGAYEESVSVVTWHICFQYVFIYVSVNCHVGLGGQ
jgi:hypothetical protein